MKASARANRGSGAAGPEAPKAPPKLRVGFVLAQRFTLTAFAGFVDALRLAADEGDRSRPLECYLACVSWFHRQDFETEFSSLRMVSNRMFVAQCGRIEVPVSFSCASTRDAT